MTRLFEIFGPYVCFAASMLFWARFEMVRFRKMVDKAIKDISE